jgi:hypothetical protein
MVGLALIGQGRPDDAELVLGSLTPGEGTDQERVQVAVTRAFNLYWALDLPLTCDNLVRSCSAVDLVEGCAEVGGQGVGGGDGVLPGLDLDGAIAAGSLDELADGPAGLVLDPAADRQCREDDGQVRLDRVAQVVVDRAGLQVVLGHPEALLDLEEPVVGADHEVRGDRGAVRADGEVGDVALDPGQGPRFVLQFAVDTLGDAV